MNPNITFVDNNEALAKLCDGWSRASYLALDTEFIRTDTFYPIPALLQIYDGHQCYLLDLVSLGDFSLLIDILKNPSIIKVLHSCSEDLEIFDGLFKTIPAPLFDTQIAAAFLGYGFSIGYSRLIKILFDADPPKDESRSNWLQRPLSTDQIEYAALDVIYLYKVYLHLHQQLQQTSKEAWAMQYHLEMLQNYQNNQKPEHYFLRFKNAWQLSNEQRQSLFQLCLWREKEARKRNKPRNRILRDEILFEHARRNTLPSGYNAVAEMSRLAPDIEPPLPREMGDLVKKLKHHIEKTAQALNIAPEVLGRKKDLTALASSDIAGTGFQLPDAFKGWRYSIIGEDLLTIANEWKAVTQQK